MDKEQKINYIINFINNNLYKIKIVNKIEEFDSDFSDTDSDDDIELNNIDYE